MRLPFLRPKDDPAAARARKTTAAGAEDTVQAARRRARQRLVGALVLLAVAVIGFPVLFETQPRPLPPDTPIEPTRGAGRVVGSVTSIAPPTLPTLARAPMLPPADAGLEVAPGGPASVPAGAPAVAAAASAPRLAAPGPAAMASAARPASAAQTVAKTAAVAPKASVEAPAKPASAARTDEAKRANSLLAGGPASPAPSAAANSASAAATTRFVVQAGAYGDAAGLREARQAVEKLGLKSYTQVVQTDTGKRTRVRVGPFDSRQEADAVAARVKAAGLPVAVLAL